MRAAPIACFMHKSFRQLRDDEAHPYFKMWDNNLLPAANRCEGVDLQNILGALLVRDNKYISGSRVAGCGLREAALQ